MSQDSNTGRAFKKRVLDLLAQPDQDGAVRSLSELPPRKVINPLLALLLHDDEIIRWRAVVTIGRVVSCLALTDMEAARVIMRRLMWSLNDESGGIGWGAPESMGEILASHEGLCEEYALILASYLNPDGNFLEHPLLQRGLLWGVARLASVRPDALVAAGDHLMPFLDDPDPAKRGLAARALGAIAHGPARHLLEGMTGDGAEFRFLSNHRFVISTVGEVARVALRSIMLTSKPRSHAI